MMTFVRLFIPPIGITVSYYLFSDNKDINWITLLIVFGLSFLFIWILDRTIVQWSINKGQKLTKDKEEKQINNDR